MKYLAYAKVLVLVVVLVFVVRIMNSTSPGSISRMMATLGIDVGGAASPGLHPSSGPESANAVPLNLCPTRIHAISWSDGRVIEEAKDGMKSNWLAGEPAPHEIGALEMEKWLSRHCQVRVEPQTVKSGESVTFRPLLKVEYVDHASQQLFRSDSGIYRFGEQVFTSLDLNRAVGELTQVANFTKAANEP